MTAFTTAHVAINTTKKHVKYRPDIDGLRAIAVLAVVIYHYAPKMLPGGFIGVDIFFVISGYLITGIIARQFETKSFSLLDFYQRRIRRVFPALLMILVFSLVVGWLIMFSYEYEALGKHVTASAMFAQNFLLWSEAGYFDSDAITKPLLQLWSLAVEEQFYIVWPLLLWLVMHNRWPVLAAITVIAGCSFALNAWGIHQQRHMDIFYLPFGRAWELMIGAWLAIAQRQNLPWLKRFATAQSVLGLALIIASLVVIRPEGFPGFWGIIPVLGAALIISSGPHTFINQNLLSWRPAIWVGLISYPLYIWHWTLLSFLIIALGDSVDSSQLRKYKIVAFVCSFILAWLTYRWIEQPIRKRENGKTTVILVTLMIAIGSTGFSIYLSNGIPERPLSFIPKNAERYLASISRTPHAPNCFDFTTDAVLPELWSCTLGDKDANSWIIAFGDSHALSMIPALDNYGKKAKIRIVFTGLSGCPPLLETQPERLAGPACKTLNHKIAELAKSEGAAAAIMIARWTYYIGGTTKPSEIQPIRIANLPAVTSDQAQVSGKPALEHGLEAILYYFQSNKIPVVLVQDNPQQSVKLPSGIVRFSENLTDSTFNANAVSLEEHHRNQSEVNKVLESAAARFPNVSILNMDKVLCGTEVCPWTANGKFLYFDDDHLSVSGSMKVLPLLTEHLNKILDVKLGNE